MPRNGSGTYTLPAGNPVVTGTTISSTTHNNTNNDIAAALTQSISADGQTPWTGATTLFTGSSIPTPPLASNSQQIANTEFVQKVAPISSFAYQNLQITTTGLSAIATVTADALIVRDASSAKLLPSVSVTPSLAVSGVNGLDTGTSATNTWYYVFVIWDGTTTAGLLSLSDSAPTLPAGYTHFRRVGAIRSDGTANKFPLRIKQLGNIAVYQPIGGGNTVGYPQMYSTSSVVSLVPVSVSAFIPSTSQRMAFTVAASSSIFSVVTNNSNVAGVHALANGGNRVYFEATLETNIIYVTNSSANQATLHAAGWTDSI